MYLSDCYVAYCTCGMRSEECEESLSGVSDCWLDWLEGATEAE